MENLKLFVIHNEEKMLSSVGNHKAIKKFNLNNLTIEDKYKNNSLAENRFLIYLSNNTSILKDYDYVGICSASWNSKYKIHESNPKVIQLEKIPDYIDCFKKNFIYVSALVKDWYKESKEHHVGMELYINELLSRNNFKNKGTSFYSNNFICKKNIMIDFLRWWRSEFDYFFEKYKFDYEYDSESFHNYKSHVNCAYFYERLTIAYFANKDYNIFQLSPKNFNVADNEIRIDSIKKFNKSAKIF